MFKALKGIRRHCGPFVKVWLAGSVKLAASLVGSGRGGAGRHHLHSALSFLLTVNGTLLATVELTVETPPAMADTPPFTSPTPIEGTVVTADLVSSRLLPPTQATPPTAAPTTPFVTLKRPPVTRHTIPGCCTAWSLPESENKSNGTSSINVWASFLPSDTNYWTASQRWKHLENLIFHQLSVSSEAFRFHCWHTELAGK